MKFSKIGSEQRKKYTYFKNLILENDLDKIKLFYHPESMDSLKNFWFVEDCELAKLISKTSDINIIAYFTEVVSLKELDTYNTSYLKEELKTLFLQYALDENRADIVCFILNNTEYNNLQKIEHFCCLAIANGMVDIFNIFLKDKRSNIVENFEVPFAIAFKSGLYDITDLLWQLKGIPEVIKEYDSSIYDRMQKRIITNNVKGF
jgi:hypothetical protein